MKRWLKRFAAVGVVVLGLIALAVFIGRASIQRMGERKLADLTASLDATDPGWRLNDLEAARLAAPPEDQNSAAIVLRIYGTCPAEWEQLRKAGVWTGEPITNGDPPFVPLIWMLLYRELTAPARDAARESLLRPEVLARPGGRFPLTIGDNPFDTRLQHPEQTKMVCDFLGYDARLAAWEGNPERGIRAARAALVAARSIGDEPLLFSQIVRIVGDRAAALSAFQVLAWGEPKDGLAELQAEFRAEADFPWIQHGLRGERALNDRIFDSIETGKITADQLSAIGLLPLPVKTLGLSFYRGILPEDRAATLRLMTEYVEAAKLPYPQQKAAFARITHPEFEFHDLRYEFTSILVQDWAKWAARGTQSRAELLAASVAIACERFRQASGRWPKTLEEIPKEILPELPTDPYNGQPIRYRTFPDGIAVFCMEEENPMIDQIRDPLAAQGRGWKLWNPEFRGRPTPAVRHPPQRVDQPGATK